MRLAGYEVITYTSSNSTVTWVEPCWCCGQQVRIGVCDAEAACFELMGYCEPCENWHVAEAIRHIWDADGNPAGIETHAVPFDSETEFRWCMKHDKREGRDPN